MPPIGIITAFRIGRAAGRIADGRKCGVVELQIGAAELCQPCQLVAINLRRIMQQFFLPNVAVMVECEHSPENACDLYQYKDNHQEVNHNSKSAGSDE